MKRIVLRLSALAAVVLLSWIAIAYAQRETDSPESPTTEFGRSADATGHQRSRLNIATEATQPNPLRGAAQPIGSQQPPASNHSQGQSPWAIEPASYPPPGDVTSQVPTSTEPSGAGAPPDPFGIQATGRRPSSPQRPETNGNGFSQQPDPYATDNRPQPLRAPLRADQNQNAPDGPYRVQANRTDESDSRLRQQNPPPSYDDRRQPLDAGPYTARLNPSVPNRLQDEPSSAPLSSYRDPPASSSSPPARQLDGPEAPNRFDPSRDRFGAETPPASSFSNEGTGRPASDRRLDGQQTPQLSIQKVAPEGILVGKPAVFRVEVKNTGKLPAQGVEIRDQIPQGTRLIDTKPPASRGAQGELVWTLGKIEPGGGASVEMQLMPTAEGEIGSVATVHFSASASTRTVATKPELVVDVSAPKTVLIDGQMTLTIRVSNPGTGVASGVVLEEHIPSCLQHPAGTELEYEVGDLAPGQSKTLELKLTAVRPGAANNLLIARADAVAEVKKPLPIEVVAPELKLEMSGPKNRYLERQATYELAVSNPGTAPARDVRLLAELPRGLKFVSANNNAHYDSKTRTVQWALAELPTGETGTVQLTALPVEIGRHTFQFRGTAERALTVKKEEQILVDGIAAIRFEVVDVKDPIEVGAETTYEIRVLNQGSKEATQVSLAAALPPGLQLVAAEGPDSLPHQVQGNHVVFKPLRRLSPKVDVTYRIRVQGQQPGDQRVRVQLSATELQTPVTKEESTRVFSDR